MADAVVMDNVHDDLNVPVGVCREVLVAAETCTVNIRPSLDSGSRAGALMEGRFLKRGADRQGVGGRLSVARARSSALESDKLVAALEAAAAAGLPMGSWI